MNFISLNLAYFFIVAASLGQRFKTISNSGEKINAPKSSRIFRHMLWNIQKLMQHVPRITTNERSPQTAIKLPSNQRCFADFGPQAKALGWIASFLLQELVVIRLCIQGQQNYIGCFAFANLLVWCLMWALRLRSLLATAPSKFPRMKSEAWRNTKKHGCFEGAT